MDRADCPVFRPSRKEMSRSFEKYIESIEQECLPFGICKITAAKGWTPCAQGYTGQDFDWEIARIEQHITRETMAAGVYTAEMTPLRKQSVRAFKEQTECLTEKRLRPPVQHLNNLAGLESAYWRTIPGATEYAADNEGSLFDESIKGWNLANLDSSLSRGLASDPSSHKLKGVNTPYLYYGRWKATFAWHTEDMDLHSVNYLHYGAPKVWYCIPPPERQKMDAFVAKKLYAQHGRCREFMRHKTVLIKPEELQANGITVQKVVQHPGDFIINFPGAYHSGFNVGFNCAESTNFATKSWIQHGAVAQYCRCTPHQEPVRLDMGLFLAEAPDEHTRQLVLQRMAKDRAARGEPLDASSDMDIDQASGSDQDSCNLRHKHSKAKTKGRTAPHHADKGAVDKPQRAVKQIKTALNKGKQKSKHVKADSKQLAAVLKAAKHAEQAPAAAAKLPQPRQALPASPTQPPLPQSKSKSPVSPSKARGRPKGSTKAALAARKSSEPSPLAQHQSSLQQLQQQQQQALQQQALQQQRQQQQLLQEEQQLLEQSGTSCEPAMAQTRGKRKRVSVEDRLRALRQKTAEAVNWMTGCIGSKQAPDQAQVACQDEPGQHTDSTQHPQHAHLAQHTQQAQHAHHALRRPQRSNSGQGSSIQQCQAGAQEGSGQDGSGDDVADMASVGEATSGHSTRSDDRPNQDQPVFTEGNNMRGKPQPKTLLPVSRTLKWRGTRTRSQRASHRATGEGCPSSFQRLLSR